MWNQQEDLVLIWVFVWKVCLKTELFTAELFVLSTVISSTAATVDELLTYQGLVAPSRKYQHMRLCSLTPSQSGCRFHRIQRRRTGRRLQWTRHSTSWDALTSSTSYHRAQQPADNDLYQTDPSTSDCFVIKYLTCTMCNVFFTPPLSDGSLSL